MKRRDPIVPAAITSVALIVLGFVAIALGKRVVARTLKVYDQIPAVISGGLVGIALVIVGCALLVVQVGRRLEAQAKHDEERVLDAASALVQALRDRPVTPAVREAARRAVRKATAKPRGRAT
ncbi:MAG TPA: hypothetical protein VHE83_15440 [Mycobacteriales bacterium]|nr:hypothetical protein [Mycobacteriales bacterium]